MVKVSDLNKNKLNIIYFIITILLNIKIFIIKGIETIAGGHGTMWTTILQIGELVNTAQKVSMFEPYVYSD